ncbi:MAG: DUF896 domain-containing protein [Syntrophomonas sp.]|uniref:DUF896 domain-containing protein n=1 Tax=Syntrophomonas sp. TaxID=2053627 RepID=UPI00263A349E|nr:DUF896 domain-containing protein [Syntrophomonas sp.]MDD2510361.1 DUF896 domain-containing protein [Syntrophomonas sp.]MDD3879021.1 DUF896 domain-containing protein [Syntrophomonas sp.]MDD4626584.1 DUF896 domain-containing protein [Syntrophomonas sp.]
MTESIIKRINELAKKKREQGLSSEELQEQKKLYDIYLAGIRQQVKSQIEAISAHPAGCDCCKDQHHHDGECQH